jgi:hypothetical protein
MALMTTGVHMKHLGYPHVVDSKRKFNGVSLVSAHWRTGWITLAALMAFAVVAMLVAPTAKAGADSGVPEALPATPAGAMLVKWIQANNSGDPQQIKRFIQANYGAELLKKVDATEHLAFYVDGHSEFGRLDPNRFVVKKNDPYSVSVYLMRLDIPDDQKLKPENIIVVDVDVSPGNPAHLARAIGFGSLLCAIREGRAEP